MGDNIKRSNIHVIGIQERKRKQTEEYLKKWPKFSKVDENCNPTDPRSSVNPKEKETTPRYIIVKLLRKK